MAITTVISAFLGLLRDRFLAESFGAGVSLDVYFAAFIIPNFVYGILITGGLIAAFLPVFSKTFENDKEEGWSLINNLINALTLVLLTSSLILFILAPQIVRVIAPGFTQNQLDWTAFLTRIMMISPILLGLSSLLSGVLKYFDRFTTYAIAPILYNLGIIFGILVLVPVFGLVGLAYGVVLGSFLHMIIQVPAALKIGFKYDFVLDFSSEKLKRIFYLIIPRMIGQASSQINLVVITALASTLTVGSLSIFNFADHLQAMPIRVFGVSFAIAAFPSLSKDVATGKMEQFLDNFFNSARKIIFVIFPIAFLTLILRVQIVDLVLGVGRFTPSDMKLTAAALGIFSFSFFAHSLIHLLIRAYFSFEDTKTPVYGSVGAVIINIALAFVFIFLFEVEGFQEIIRRAFNLSQVDGIEVLAFPIAFFFSTLWQFIFLYSILKKRIDMKKKNLKKSTIKLFGASLIMAGGALVILNKLSWQQGFLQDLVQVAVILIFSGAVYFLLALAFNCSEPKAILNKIKQR